VSHLDRLAAAAARAVLAWSTAHAHPARREWARGLAAELDEISSGTEQLAWALVPTSSPYRRLSKQDGSLS